MLFLLFSPLAYATPPSVTVVLSENEGSYAEFRDELKKALYGSDIVPSVIVAGDPIPNSGLAIAVGMKAAAAAAASKAPAVLDVLVPRGGYEQLLRDFPPRAGARTSSAVFLDQPEQRLAHLIALALPGKRNVGLLFSPPQEGLGRLRRVLEEHGLALREQKVDAKHPLPDALQEALDSSDVLLALPDAAVYNGSTIRNILLASYRHGVPLIGFSPGYVNAGALCAVYSTPAQIAAQVAELIRQFDESESLPAPHYPHEFEVMVNEQVARSLGLRIKSAASLKYEIKTEIGEAP